MAKIDTVNVDVNVNMQFEAGREKTFHEKTSDRIECLQRDKQQMVTAHNLAIAIQKAILLEISQEWRDKKVREILDGALQLCGLQRAPEISAKDRFAELLGDKPYALHTSWQSGASAVVADPEQSAVWCSGVPAQPPTDDNIVESIMSKAAAESATVEAASPNWKESCDNFRKQFTEESTTATVDVFDSSKAARDMVPEQFDGIVLIGKERNRQILECGYTLQHDVQEHSQEHSQTLSPNLLSGASAFIAAADAHSALATNIWHRAFGGQLKQFSTDRVENLVKAGAMIVAELDRILLPQSGVFDYGLSDDILSDQACIADPAIVELTAPITQEELDKVHRMEAENTAPDPHSDEQRAIDAAMLEDAMYGGKQPGHYIIRRETWDNNTKTMRFDWLGVFNNSVDMSTFVEAELKDSAVQFATLPDAEAIILQLLPTAKRNVAFSAELVGDVAPPVPSTVIF